MSDEHEDEIDVDMRVSCDDGVCGYSRIEIVALTPDAEVTLAEEYKGRPNIMRPEEKYTFKGCQNVGVPQDGFDFYICDPCFDEFERALQQRSRELHARHDNN